ncbi:hypothetical protein DLAC_10140 [Tieghemostelium lacteum]|uniref:H/ACA ribonucleoprotein complex non-core subunit NAF1 n=1 Tax=Tieghemostelium lacteum TaxID=361077 RepID=A0A151Z683_TIELA|nr:hypothetical protein DLAC_10140 [Tieghemostelium lacteum]|eukprot:KYQ89469.1 hypothetical protein DLAC_10140 [Tieghemostelium lacteum]
MELSQNEMNPTIVDTEINSNIVENQNINPTTSLTEEPIPTENTTNENVNSAQEQQDQQPENNVEIISEINKNEPMVTDMITPEKKTESEHNKQDVEMKVTETSIQTNEIQHEDNIKKDEIKEKKSVSSDSSSSESSDDSSDDSDDNLDDIIEKPKEKQIKKKAANKRKLDHSDDDEGGSAKSKSKVDYELPKEQPVNIEIPENVKLIEIGYFSHKLDDMLVFKSNKIVQAALDLDSIVFLSNRQAIGRIHDVLGPVYNPIYTVRIPENIEVELKSKVVNQVPDKLVTDQEPSVNNVQSEKEFELKSQSPEKLNTEKDISTEVKETENVILNPKESDQDNKESDQIKAVEVEPLKVEKKKIVIEENDKLYYVNLPDLSHLVVPSEIYTRGYDANEEDDADGAEVDFSDDEKERQYKSMKKMNNRQKHQNPNQQPHQQQNRQNQNRQHNNRQRNNQNNKNQIPPSPSNFTLEYKPLARRPEVTNNNNNTPTQPLQQLQQLLNTTQPQNEQQQPQPHPTSSHSSQFQNLLQQYSQYHQSNQK